MNKGSRATLIEDWTLKVRNRTLRKKKYWFRAKLQKILEGKIITVVMAIVTIYALIGVSYLIKGWYMTLGIR